MSSQRITVTPRSRLAAPRRLLRLRSDAALAERFAEGDEAAFAILFERHRASVAAVCVGVLSSRHDAEDAAQETFAALAVALRSSPPRELRAWLARVARNASIDLARRRRTREKVTHELSDVEAPDRVTASHVVKDELASVIAGIRELPESQRTALLMRELAGHSYREIADLLESDEDAVRGLIARARIGLRQYREAAELPCATARAAIAAEPDGRRHDRTVRRHVRGCAPCRAYRSALRDDARPLRGLLPIQASGAGGGSAAVGLAAKGALLGTAATQVTAACAVSVCAVGGIALLAPALTAHRRSAPRPVAAHRSNVRRTVSAGHPGATTAGPGVAPRAWSPGAAGRSRQRATSSLAVTIGAGFRATAGSDRSSATAGSRPSVSAVGRFSVPAGGRSTEPSRGSAPNSTGGSSHGSAPGAAGPSDSGSPGTAGGSPSAGSSGRGSGPSASQQSPASTPGSGSSSASRSSPASGSAAGFGSVGGSGSVPGSGAGSTSAG